MTQSHTCGSLLVFSIVLLVCFLQAPVFADDNYSTGGVVQLFSDSSDASLLPFTHSWRDKLSSDLLQLVDPSASPSGSTTAALTREMELLGQLRFDSQNRSEVHVTLTLIQDSSLVNVTRYLNESRSDPGFGLVTGWVPTDQISNLSSLPEVREIHTVLSPVSSGLINTANQSQASGVEKNLNQTSENSSAISSEISDTAGNASSGIKLTTTETRWKGKLSTDLVQLLDDHYLSPGQSPGNAADLMRATGELRNSKNNQSEVMVTTRLSSGSSVEPVQSYFSNAGTDSRYGRVSGWLTLQNLSRLAKEPAVLSVMSQLPAFTSGVTTEGDDILRTCELRNATNLSGKGVKVGIISDGVTSLDTVVAAGELPSNVHVISDSIGGDEGTAMLQVVHDIAPDAELYFSDRGSSQIEFVQAMDHLISDGCRIICDDITYVEPFFEDGYIARNIRDRVLSYDILYVTSAGNFAQEHYQAPFNGYMNQGYLWHDFQGANGSKDLKFTAPPHSAGHVILQWDDRFSESSNNYDLFLYNSEMREIGRSVKIQDGDDDPMEYCRFVNEDESSKDFYVRVVQAGGENRTIELYVLPLGGSQVSMDPCVPEDSMFGQQAVPEAISVGAVIPDLNRTVVEPYSSRGPITIKYPVPELRQKPELSAPDNILVSTGKGVLGSFSGTSASAPHIAGMSALLWEANTELKADEVKRRLLNATPSSGTGWNPDTGFGVPDASLLFSAIQAANRSSDPCLIVNESRLSKPREMEQPETLALYAGWNMISIPYPLKEGNNTGSIFSCVNTTSHTIWRYSPDTRHWDPVGTDDLLYQMDVIWVHAMNRTDISLTYDNDRRNMTARHLSAGWNPLGIPGKNTLTASDLLAPLGSSWSYVLVYDSREQQFRQVIVNGGTGAYSDARLLYPTEGFWIFMNNPGIIIP